MKTIAKIYYNWFATPEGSEEDHLQIGDKGRTLNGCDTNLVTEIKEHAAGGEGDKWYYDVIFNDGQVVRIFNPNRVIYQQSELKQETAPQT